MGALTPRLRVDGADPLWTWNLDAQRTFGAYSNDPDIQVFADRFSAKSLYQPSDDDTLLLEAGYVDALDPFEFDGGLIQQRDSERAIGQGRLALHRFEAQVSGRGWWYRDPVFQDGTARSWAARVLPMRNRISVLSFGHRQQRMNLDNRGLTADITTFGMRRNHARWLRSELQVGRAETRFHDGSETQVNPAAALVIWMQRGQRADPIETKLHVAYDITTTVSASVERQWEAGHVRATAERLLDVEGGLYRNPTVVRRVVLEWESRSLDSKVFTLRGTYGLVRPFRGGGTNANIFRVGARYGFPLRSWLAFQTSYDFWRQEYPGGGPDEDFDRHRVAVALIARSGLR